MSTSLLHLLSFWLHTSLTRKLNPAFFTSLLCVRKRSGVFPVPAFNLQPCSPNEAVSEIPPYLSFQLQNDIPTFALSYVHTSGISSALGDLGVSNSFPNQKLNIRA
jgi:hypothetical protein